ncbi:FmdB family zinc ribbon protein [Nocardia mikamii]|uniref:FmdB family zinc ribbon protein n=1 Tax=Nocardia mikamii TaxID=508464 RepID=UPI0007A38A04|nr:zinc ribbon domain-containing protein [Nocardia mikamii]
MPTYAYRCRECTESFELTRPMSESGDPAVCPGGHRDTVKLLTTVASPARPRDRAHRPAAVAAAAAAAADRDQTRSATRARPSP